jgi:hypothetical protein
MLNAQHEVRTLDEASERAASRAPVLITGREVALDRAIALQALRIPFHISNGGWDNVWSPRQQA